MRDEWNGWGEGGEIDAVLKRWVFGKVQRVVEKLGASVGVSAVFSTLVVVVVVVESELRGVSYLQKSVTFLVPITAGKSWFGNGNRGYY